MKKCRTSINAVSQSCCMLKLLRIMKLTTILLLIATLQVFASGVYSQQTDLTLNLGETNVGQVLTEIENQSEFYFLFNQKLVDTDRKVNIQLSDKKIGEVLDQVFSATNTDYVVIDRQIVLSPKEYLAEVKVAMQPRTITGTVTDEGGEPIQGVTVLIKGTTQGTITNVNGIYSISNVSENTTLQFSFVGMLTQEVVAGNQSTINITMLPDAIGLEQVVVIGYGTAKKVDLTGAVKRANIDAFREMPNVSIAVIARSSNRLKYWTGGCSW